MMDDELLKAGGISSEELQDRADEIAKVCAECGMTSEELTELARACGYSLEDTMRELMEKAGVFDKARRGPTGFEGKRPPMDTRPKYTAPESTAGRKKKHGRERGRKL